MSELTKTAIKNLRRMNKDQLVEVIMQMSNYAESQKEANIGQSIKLHAAAKVLAATNKILTMEQRKQIEMEMDKVASSTEPKQDAVPSAKEVENV